jgi:hypothetical protein
MGIEAHVAFMKRADNNDKVDSWYIPGSFDFECNGSHVLWDPGGPLIPSIRLIQVLPFTPAVTALLCYIVLVLFRPF